MCMLSLHCRTLVILQKITEVHCINSSALRNITVEEDSVDLSSNWHQFVSCGEPDWSHFFNCSFSLCLLAHAQVS
jgi:hypothetical protein